ncbi:Arabinanase/levansucrase/invertase [Trichodelitschia bisporula]|uniref:Arabinanase/levansucrase/invertase n=1 Tax=Trichodelitschia bisporula TaxID=703511 RepID=A0A6G1I0R9_9PEZI|nr:Arabinanase/levansucrase/invertase [Trichodelitschia bisporula]
MKLSLFFVLPVLGQQFNNPVLWQDLADLDVLRVNNTYYYSASTMHYSPGAPVLRSYDLVNWEFIGHSVPVLDWSPKYDLSGGNAYVKGIWASFLGYRPRSDLFYWGGCIEFAKTHIYTAPAATGPWTRRSTIDSCYYDAGLLVDDDDRMYVAYGNTNISVAQMSPDGLRQVRTQVVFRSPKNVGTIEGSRFYKYKGSYYIFVTKPPDAQYVLKAASPFGPYTMKVLVNRIPSPVAGSGAPHQGGLVTTPSGAWYYMAFIDAYPGGRVPVLAPVSWGADGFPTVQAPGSRWAASYPYPGPPRAVKSSLGVETFEAPTLGPDWEWNHNPDVSKFALGNGLVLRTATRTLDLYAARNTLTRRIVGPQSSATIELDFEGMRDGDRAGLALLRDSSAWIGVQKDGGEVRVVVVHGIEMDDKWRTAKMGSEVEAVPIQGGTVWLRLAADIRPGAGRAGIFSYSTDGRSWHTLGRPFVMKTAWQFFMGYRFAVFNFATKVLGGEVTVRRFELNMP